MALGAIPYLRWHRFVRPYLCCLARIEPTLRQEPFLGGSTVLLSVLIDTYDHQRLIAKAIGSVLEQDYPAPEREIIVIDDGSTDGTAEIVRQFEPQVRLISKTNGGQASAFNAGIPECRGEVIVFLDGDDWWAPGKLRRMAEIFCRRPCAGDDWPRIH